MSSAGFGAPGTPGQLDQPWGHRWESNKPKPSQVDNPPAIGPGGTIHCSIWDFARFAMFHLNGANGEGRLLKKETFTKLHTPPEGQDYACGWSRQNRTWADGHTLNHAGSNTLNYAVIWIAPRIHFAAVAATNLGGDAAQKACDQTVSALVDKYAKASAAKPPEI